MEQYENQDGINRRVYHARDVDRHYRHTGLDGAEIAAFLTHQPALANRDVLDLGIGTGRTTRYLAPLARSYVGCDYSPRMVEYSGNLFSKVDIRLLDMRDLRDFGDASFDAVLAVCNLLDAVSHEDRLKTLSEIRRVLREDGRFFFSSHNRDFHRLGQGPQLRRSRNPVTQVNHFRSFFRQWKNCRRIRKHYRHEEDYSLVSDIGHDFSVLHYYIDRNAQARQLASCSFELLDTFDLSGARLANEAPDEYAPHLFYVARPT